MTVPPRRTAKKAATKKASEKAPAKKPTAKKAAAKKSPVPEAPAREDASVAERERVVFPREVYGERKDDIKAPIKDLGMKWQFLGPGKGRYHGEGVQVFVQHTDAGADFTVWGEDSDAVKDILAEWRKVAGKEAFAAAKAEAKATAAAEKEEAESEATRLWRLAEPQRRPGEPEFFFKKRRAEWDAQKPR